jgi:glycine dehydrogenase subunit 2
VAVGAHLTPFLPAPRVARNADGTFRLDRDRPQSVGRVHGWHGNFGVLVRAYTYIRALGPDGLTEVSTEAILNANYLMHRLKGAYDLPFDRHCMHEFVLSGRGLRKYGAPPTWRSGCSTSACARRRSTSAHRRGSIMIEPTETERSHARPVRRRLLRIAEEAQTDASIVTGARGRLPSPDSTAPLAS